MLESRHWQKVFDESCDRVVVPLALQIEEEQEQKVLTVLTGGPGKVTVSNAELQNKKVMNANG